MNQSDINKNFTQPLLKWYEQFGRKDLPWQHPKQPYPVWISEVMLQQTQVKTVIPYFNAFMKRFPDIQTLAKASLDDVLSHWSGLGYYSRGRNIHKSANLIISEHGGCFPNTFDDLLRLPGVGESTASAILSIAYNQPTAILDGNVKRVLARYFKVDGDTKRREVIQTLWELASLCMSKTRCSDYTQAIMDLGATCCKVKQPLCITCPLKASCSAYKDNQVDMFPQKPPKKAKPIKSAYFFLIYNQNNSIYLEQRPEKGLWGGLWCLPETKYGNGDAIDYLKQHYNASILSHKPLITFTHHFTHFQLNIHALATQVLDNIKSNASTPGGWYALNRLSDLGIAKPIRLIVDAFQKELVEEIG
jgi:A/G-specific adenine glycosylase